MSDNTKNSNPFENLLQNGQKAFSEFQKLHGETALTPEKLQELQKEFASNIQKLMPNVDFKKQQAEFYKAFSSESIQKQLSEMSALSNEALKNSMSSVEGMNKNLQELFKTMSTNPFDLPSTVFEQQAEAIKSMNRNTENFLDKVIQKTQENKGSK